MVLVIINYLKLAINLMVYLVSLKKILKMEIKDISHIKIFITIHQQNLI